MDQSVARQNRAKLKKWRIAKGKELNPNKKPLSYQQIADMANARAGKPILKQPTVCSWGVRGHVPGDTSADALRAVPEFEDFPLFAKAV